MYGREVICLDLGGDIAGVSRILDDREWQVCHTRSPREVEQVIAEREIKVGLVSFGPDHAATVDVQALENLLENTSSVAWVALVEPGVLESAFVCRLIALYFRDYVTAPFQATPLLYCVGHAYGMAAMETAAASPDSDPSVLCREMLGDSEILRQVMRTLKKCASADAPVTITGESGTGKELAARAIHRHSAQRDGPFVAVNCGTIPENLIRADLFGYTRDAFNGANQDKIGRIEAAASGTLFLDEIGDLSLSLQVNLLRFLQEGVIEKVGAHESIRVNTRVIAATHKNLEDAVEQGEFREDLYYRLNVLHVHLPPLRERADDIEYIANAYLARYASTNHSRAVGFSQAALRLIRSYPWPGNVRELINRVQRAVVMSDRRLLSPEDMGLDRRSAARAAKTLDEARADAEKDALYRSLKHAGDNVAEAARKLGISRPTVYRLIEKHGIQPDSEIIAAGAQQRRWRSLEHGKQTSSKGQ